jgi:hypothetical protein
MTEALEKFEKEKERKENIAHRDVLLSIGAILATKEGKELFEYLFKNLDVAQVPEIGMQGMDLHDYIGFLRAGNSIYKLACEAAYETAASIIAKIEKEKYDELKQRFNIEHGINADTDSTDE